jgi:hypothetical protein
VRAQTIGLLVGVSFIVADVTGRAEVGRTEVTSGAYQSALQFFNNLPPGDIHDALRFVRPVAVSTQGRWRALLTLPSQGELPPTAREAAYLAQLQPVLTFHDRLDIVTIKIIDLARADVGLHARSILLLSRRALTLLSVAELQGIVAHEMGHDYFWNDYYDARQRHDRVALYEIELKCDGIAALTMKALRVDPDAVGSGLQALARFNEALAPINAANYPDFDERMQFMGDVLALHRAR